ncbi:hypothetical protein BJX70DRAFT_398953 [Aspergillus crustosus]
MLPAILLLQIHFNIRLRMIRIFFYRFPIPSPTGRNNLDIKLALASLTLDDDDDDSNGAAGGPLRSPWQSVLHYARQFDAVGLFLLSGGVALFLLPFNPYTSLGRGSLSV